MATTAAAVHVCDHLACAARAAQQALRHDCVHGARQQLVPQQGQHHGAVGVGQHLGGCTAAGRTMPLAWSACPQPRPASVRCNEHCMHQGLLSTHQLRHAVHCLVLLGQLGCGGAALHARVNGHHPAREL